MTEAERRERWRRTKAEGLAQIARVDALLSKPRREAPDDGIHRREIVTGPRDRVDDVDHVEDAVARWKADADAVSEARERETRRRARVVTEAERDRRQHSDAVTGLQRDVAQHGADLVDALKAVNAMGSAIAQQFDAMCVEIAALRERLALMEAKAKETEATYERLRTDLQNATTELAVQGQACRSELGN
jgi:chromosome segregation ATPase